jgi:hypothetical protein
MKNHITAFLSYETEQPTTMAQAVTLLIRHELIVSHIFDSQYLIWRQYFHPKRGLASIGLHCVT